ncbi:hypothetical protein [Candidatus Vampirococcus lugosii]|uniref:Uncharacterized protein n=1 Tax=Candidatus Vampirococcus lugosii TaxID=2789015 RepID=A0ABS5QLL9_9BACT|nr:hypothetical protein [Candidatus Vampirococcus lugosii]MBS8122096.1 hypothetical protein [Candidatus Vampirococcus lugosii]
MLKDLYNSYVNKDCNKMKDLLISLEKQDPDSPYLKKYKQMYQNICKDGQNLQKEGKMKIGGKAIQCTNCLNYLRTNKNVKKIYQNYKNGKTKQLEFNCENCGIKFVWQQHNIKSIFLENVGIGKKINIENKNYTISSIIRYKGREKKKHLINLEYNEYLLIDNSLNRYYLFEIEKNFSSGFKEYKTEFSREITPPFYIKKINSSYIESNKGNLSIYKIHEVDVKKINGKNLKSYFAGKKIILYYFSFSGKNYILEKELYGEQKKIGIYQMENINLGKNKKFYEDEGLNLFYNKLIATNIINEKNSFIFFIIILITYVGIEKIKEEILRIAGDYIIIGFGPKIIILLILIILIILIFHKYISKKLYKIKSYEQKFIINSFAISYYAIIYFILPTLIIFLIIYFLKSIIFT